MFDGGSFIVYFVMLYKGNKNTKANDGATNTTLQHSSNTQSYNANSK